MTTLAHTASRRFLLKSLHSGTKLTPIISSSPSSYSSSGTLTTSGPLCSSHMNGTLITSPHHQQQNRYFHTTPITHAKKKKRVFVKLESTAGTGYTYLKKKSQVSLQRKKVYKKFDPIVQRYAIFVEKKFKRKALIRCEHYYWNRSL